MPVNTKREVLQQPVHGKANDLAALDVPQNTIQGKAIHELFHQDTLEDNSKAQVSSPSSFFGKIAPWFFSPQVTDAKVSKTLTDIEIQNADPIKPIPELDKPELPSQASLEGVVPKLPLSLQKEEKEKISEKEVILGLSEMSPKTIDQIIATVLKAQVEIEREGAALTENSFQKLNQLRKIQEKTLDEIRKALEGDQKVANRLNTAHKIAIGASVICSICALAVAYPVFPQTVLTTCSLVAKFGTPAAACATGITTTAQGYAKVRTNEDDKKLTEHRHTMEKSSDRAKEYTDQMTTFGENDAHYKEALVKLLKILEKIKNQVLQQ